MTGAPLPVLDRLATAAEHLGEAEQRLAKAIVQGYPASVAGTPVRLLRRAAAAPGDLDRLLAAATITDFDQLRQIVLREADHALSTPVARFSARLQRQSSAAQLLAQVIEREQDNLRRTLANLQADGSFEIAAQRIVAARRRFTTGGAKSAAYAALLAADLSTSMANVLYVDGSVVRPLDVLSDVRAEDVLVAFSFRRYSSQTIITAREFHKAGGTVVGITDDPASPLAKVSDVPLIAVIDSASYANSPTAAAAVAHILATLATASAKGARRRMEKRDHLIRTLHLLEGDTE